MEREGGACGAGGKLSSGTVIGGDDDAPVAAAAACVDVFDAGDTPLIGIGVDDAPFVRWCVRRPTRTSFLSDDVFDRDASVRDFATGRGKSEPEEMPPFVNDSSGPLRSFVELGVLLLFACDDDGPTSTL